MRYILYILITTLLTVSCSQRLYTYKTENYSLPLDSKVYVEKNDSLKYSSIYSPLLNLAEIDSIYRQKDIREIDAYNLIVKSLNEKGISISSKSEADYGLEFQDYWFQRNKRNAVVIFSMKINDLDSNEGAFVVNKSFKVAKSLTEETIEEAVEQIVTPTKQTTEVSKRTIIDYPNIYDVPRFPKTQIGLNAGYSSGNLLPIELNENYESNLRSYGAFTLGVDYTFANSTGAGLELNSLFSHSSKTTNNVNEITEGNEVLGNGTISDNINILYFGAAYKIRVPMSSYKLFDEIGLGLGYLKYANNAERFGDNITFEKGNLAWLITAEIAYRVNKNSWIGIEPRFLISSFKKMKINGEMKSLDEKQGFLRAEFVLTYKWNK